MGPDRRCWTQLRASQRAPAPAGPCTRNCRLGCPPRRGRPTQRCQQGYRGRDSGASAYTTDARFGSPLRSALPASRLQTYFGNAAAVTAPGRRARPERSSMNMARAQRRPLAAALLAGLIVPASAWRGACARWQPVLLRGRASPSSPLSRAAGTSRRRRGGRDDRQGRGAAVPPGPTRHGVQLDCYERKVSRLMAQGWVQDHEARIGLGITTGPACPSRVDTPPLWLGRQSAGDAGEGKSTRRSQAAAL